MQKRTYTLVYAHNHAHARGKAITSWHAITPTLTISWTLSSSPIEGMCSTSSGASTLLAFTDNIIQASSPVSIRRLLWAATEFVILPTAPVRYAHIVRVCVFVRVRCTCLRLANTCAHTHEQTHTRARINTYTHTHTHTQIHTHTHSHTHARTHVHTHAHIRTRTQTHTQVLSLSLSLSLPHTHSVRISVSPIYTRIRLTVLPVALHLLFCIRIRIHFSPRDDYVL